MARFVETPLMQTFACDTSVVEAEQNDQSTMTTEQLFALVEEARELPDGYALRLPNDADTFAHATRFMAHEQECCPFLDISLERGAADGPLWLQITGQEGVKQFLQVELGLHLDKATAEAAGLR